VAAKRSLPTRRERWHEPPACLRVEHREPQQGGFILTNPKNAPVKNPPPQWKDLQVGDCLPPLALPPLTRHTLALYCGASGDHNPIHVDLDFARSAGQPDVFAHGMLSSAWLARLLTNWAPQSALRSLNVRFVAMTHVGDQITCTGQIAAKEPGAVRIAIQSADAQGEVKLRGEAVIVC
jgi:acyl dehydratase